MNPRRPFIAALALALSILLVMPFDAALAAAQTGQAEAAGKITAVLPVVILAARGASGLDVYGWMGSLATYGFIVAYALVSISLPRYLRDRGASHAAARIIPWLACIAMLLALVGNLYPVPEGPYGKLPFVYLAYLSAGLLWFVLRGRKAATPPR